MKSRFACVMLDIDYRTLHKIWLDRCWQRQQVLAISCNRICQRYFWALQEKRGFWTFVTFYEI